MNTEPIYRRRKSGLGTYSGNRKMWKAAYREARVGVRNETKPDPKDKGLLWKASLIVAYDRADYCDPLSLPAPMRLLAMQMVNEILTKEKIRS